ncbi:MAG: hypothetical protein PHV48_01675 [Candidatus Omnitrophica bacterium]|nr:hypothetical protein [Candidatus Omnitrophota bacterium]
MKKLAVLLVVSALLLSVGICMAAESQKWSTGQKNVMVDRNNDGKIDGVDIYDESGKVVKRGYDSNGDMNVDNWETYDNNTGMPIVVESDKAFLLQ